MTRTIRTMERNKTRTRTTIQTKMDRKNRCRQNEEKTGIPKTKTKRQSLWTMRSTQLVKTTHQDNQQNQQNVENVKEGVITKRCADR